MEKGINSWQAVQEEVLRRIGEQIWRPGDPIPHEADLADEFGCARATVNRALRQLAESGLLDRRRKAGTRVALNPVRMAKLEIPILRIEIEGKGMRYFHSLVERELKVPALGDRAKLQSTVGDSHLHIVAVHLGDGVPYAYEDRWINLDAVPKAKKVNFSEVSANEWLVRNIPFESGDIAISAVSASRKDAEILQCKIGDGLVVIDRMTRRAGKIVTAVRLTFQPGYRLQTAL